MKYFLFLNHPKGKDVYQLTKKREFLLREHFKHIKILSMNLNINGQNYNCIIDYTAFSNLSNFDCFNCQDPCCADNPTIYNSNTRDFILDNLVLYNSLTKNIDILQENGYSFDDILNSIQNDNSMVPEKTVEEEISLCTCSFKPNNKSTLCALHSMCLEKKLSSEDIIRIKPLVCNLWPLEIIAEDDMSLLYITLPDDFTTGFTIEDYYDTPCINKELVSSATFRRKNPEGFSEKNYVPFIVSYKETLIKIFGNKFFDSIKNLLISEELIFESDFDDIKEQIFKKL